MIRSCTCRFTRPRLAPVHAWRAAPFRKRTHDGERMNVLVVGLGAVGQVVAAHLQRGGARVSFYVKEKHAAAARRGFTLRALHKKQEISLRPDEVITSIAEAAQKKWDFI